jgi:hypothetical protein
MVILPSSDLTVSIYSIAGVRYMYASHDPVEALSLAT